MRKESSTNHQNERKIVGTCGMAYTLTLIGGRWKPTILWRLLNGRMRYNELRKSIPEASERMLVLQLREMEEHKLIKRTVYTEMPLRVEYELTKLGHSMQTMLDSMSDWGLMHRKEVEKLKSSTTG